MPNVRYYEDLEVGMREASARRTIGEADVSQFAGLSGDMNPIHVDRVHAEQTQFGQRIAHGLLGTSIASGLFAATELSHSLQEALVAMLGVEVKFEAPIFFGDTVHVEVELTEMRESKKGGRGIVVFERKLINQDGRSTQRITSTLLVRKRSA